MLVGMAFLMIMIVVMIVLVPSMRMVMVIVATATSLAMRMLVVIMLMVIMPVMRMIMVVMARLQVGAALGVEGRFDDPKLAAKPRHHRLDDRITTNAQAPVGDLHWQVAIAEMPAESQQVVRRLGPNLGELLRRTNNFHQPAVLKLHRITGAQGHGLRQIEQESKAAYRFHRDPAAMTIVEIEHDRIGRAAMPVAMGDHFSGADHGNFLQLDCLGTRTAGTGPNIRRKRASNGKLIAIIPTPSAGLG
jgi:hypothetical protein